MLKPGQTTWKKVLQASMPHHDSLEGLLRPPLVLSAKYDEDYGTPKRGALVFKDAVSGKMRPIVLAEVGALLETGGSSYEVTWYVTKFNPAWAVKAVLSDGSTAAVDATAYGMTMTDPNTGLKSGADTMTFAADLPANTVAIILAEAEGKALEGVVYESVLSQDFPLAVEVEGASPDKIAAGASAFVQALAGVKAKQDLLFIRTV